LLLHPNGRFAYYVHPQGAVDIFSIGSDGRLSQLASSQGPRSAAERSGLSSDGKFFFRPSKSQIFVDSVDSGSGSLSAGSGSPFTYITDSGVATNDGIIDPSGRFVFIGGAQGRRFPAARMSHTRFHLASTRVGWNPVRNCD